MSPDKPNPFSAFFKSIFSKSEKPPSVQEESPIEKMEVFAPERMRQRDSFRLAPGVDLAFVSVPAGKFWMGSDPGQGRNLFVEEQPQHGVYLDSYWISKYPITNRQYQVFVQAKGHRAPANWKNNEFPHGEDDYPVTYVSWQDANAFCDWMNSTLGRPPVRLPSEAEWEKAARGVDARLYPWGNEPPEAKHCNFELRVGGPSRVGSYSPAGDSPYGCADMAGNVWEWVNDWYDPYYYTISPDANPRGPASGSMCVLRGGGFDNNQDYIRTTYRNQGSPSYLSSYIGFRVVTPLMPTLLDF